MLHPVRVPPSKAGSLPPWMFPRGIPSAALHTKQQVPSGGRSRASPIHGSLALAFSARNMPPARRAAVPAYPRFRSAPPPPASPPPPPKIPVSMREERRFDEGQRCRQSLPLARPPPGAIGVKRCPRCGLCSFVAIAPRFRASTAGTLDPAPSGGKSGYRLFWAKQTSSGSKESGYRRLRKEALPCRRAVGP